MALPLVTPEQARFWHESCLAHEGWLVGLRHALGLVLETRGLAFSKEQKDRVEACDDAFQVRRWIRRAVIASSTDELFDDSDLSSLA